MNKLGKLEAVFETIREHPIKYLTEQSLETFAAYWAGYTDREGPSHAAYQLLKPQGFHDFVNRRFKNDSNHGAMSVVTLYSKNDSDAWTSYFNLLDDFKKHHCSEQPVELIQKNFSVSVRLEELLPAVVGRPAMYVGSCSFKLVAEFILGWLKATSELEYEETDYERRFKNLLRYVEEFDINIPGPAWHKIIWFWTMNDKKAFELFSQYVDEYLIQSKGWIQRIEFHMDRRLKARRGL